MGLVGLSLGINGLITLIYLGELGEFETTHWGRTKTTI